MRKVMVVLILILVAVSFSACKGPEPVSFEELLSYDNAIAHVRASDIVGIQAGTTYREILTRLGATRDMGSGLHIAQYVMDEKQNLYIGFADADERCAKSGTEVLRSAHPSSTREARSASEAL